MIQLILTWITVLAAIAYTLYSLWNALFAKNNSPCGGGCTSCEAKDLLLKKIEGNGKRGAVIGER